MSMESEQTYNAVDIHQNESYAQMDSEENVQPLNTIPSGEMLDANVIRN